MDRLEMHSIVWNEIYLFLYEYINVFNIDFCVMHCYKYTLIKLVFNKTQLKYIL